MNKDEKKTPGKKKQKKRLLLLLLLLLVLLLIGLGVFFLLRSPGLEGVRQALGGMFGGDRGSTGTSQATLDSLASADSRARADSLQAIADSIARQAHLDSLEEAHASARKAAAEAARKAAADSADSARAARELAPCEIDTVPPWIFPDPSGGLHRRHIAVRLLSVEPCTVEWRFAGRPWQSYTDEPILITKDTTIEFKARDTCGNVLPPRTEIYKITRPLEFRRCPDDMEFVKIAKTEFCVDRYEWPNKRDRKPISYVSLNQARDSCYMAGKGCAPPTNG